MPTTGSRSRQLAVLQAAAAALHDVGALDFKTMRDIDALCLTKVRPARDTRATSLGSRKMSAKHRSLRSRKTEESGETVEIALAKNESIEVDKDEEDKDKIF